MFKRVSALSKKTRNFAWWKNFLSYKEFGRLSAGLRPGAFKAVRRWSAEFMTLLIPVRAYWNSPHGGLPELSMDRI
jgi:hypothetical protein